MELFTLGYEKASLGDFLDTLAAAGVTRLIDIRERPQSRRAGFSKRQLAASAEAAGIDYHHFRALGTPPEGRAAHRSGDQQRFWQTVERQLATAEAQAALAAAAALARERPSCLLCYEADWRRCHRAKVAALLEQSGFAPCHLTVEPRFA